MSWKKRGARSFGISPRNAAISRVGERCVSIVLLLRLFSIFGGVEPALTYGADRSRRRLGRFVQQLPLFLLFDVTSSGIDHAESDAQLGSVVSRHDQHLVIHFIDCTLINSPIISLRLLGRKEWANKTCGNR